MLLPDAPDDVVRFLVNVSFEARETDVQLYAFFDENKNEFALLTDFETEFKQQQVIKIKTVQSMFDCDENQAIVLMDYFVKLEFVEKFDNDDSYFVLRDNIGSIQIILKPMLEVCSKKFKEENNG